jgi:hypothetical protein
MIAAKMNVTLPAKFYPSRVKTIFLFLGSLMFVAGGVFIVVAVKGQLLPGLGSICFFGMCLAVSIAQFNPKAAYLLVEPDGFTFCAMFRPQKVFWRDVDHFEVTRIVLNKMVVWNYPAENTPHMKGRAISKSIAGYEAGLPDTYGFKAEELCALLNEIKNESVLRE